MVARLITILACLLLVILGGTALAQPPISEEIDLYHGYRYEYDPAMPQRSDIAVGDGAVLHAYMDLDRGGCFATLHDPSGPREDWNFVEVFDYYDHATTFSCSDLDPMGWKLAYVGGVGQFGENDVMRIRNLDPETLEPTGPDLDLAAATDDIGYPSIARYPGGHVVLWIDGTTLWLRRCSVNLEAIDGAPVEVATGVKGAALAWKSPGGMVVWSDLDGGLQSVRLDADALPAGEPAACGSMGAWIPFDLAPLHDRWVVAWSTYQGVRLNLLDHDGALASTRLIPMDGTDSPASVCSSDSSAIVLAGDLDCIRIDRDGNQLGGPIHLGDLAYVSYDPDWMTWDPRAYACAWTGTSFAMLYHEFAQMITSREGRDPASPTPYPGYYGVPVFAQWMNEDGTLLLPEPLLASQGSVVWTTAPWTRGDRTLAVMRDLASDLWLHTMQLDRQGNAAAAPKRYRSPAYEAICHVWDCDWSTIGSPVIRPWGEGVACLYTNSSGHSSEWYTYSSEGLMIDRLSMDGDSLGRTGILIGSGEPHPYLVSVDFAARTDDALVVYSTSWTQPRPGLAELLSPAGERLRRWTFAADSIGRVTAAPLQDGYLLTWSRSGRLYSTVLDPAAPDTSIDGESLFGAEWNVGVPLLIPGPGRSLCVFAGRGPNDLEHGIHAVLFDSAGTLVDPAPVDLHEDWQNTNHTGIWDTNAFFLAWTRWTEEEGRTSWASRVGRDGSLVDATPFQLPVSSYDLAVSADSLGNVYLGYGNHIRIIDDTNPFLQEDPLVPPGEDDWPRDLRIGRILPNPNRGPVYLEVQLPAGNEARMTIHDSEGRLMHETRMRGPRSGIARVWDGLLPGGRRAPAGAYYMRIEAGGETTSRTVMILH